MQITVSIDHTFNDADALVEFAAAVKSLFARFSTNVVAPTRPPVVAPVVEKAPPVSPPPVDIPETSAESLLPVQDAAEAPVDTEPKAKVGRPRKSKVADKIETAPAVEKPVEKVAEAPVDAPTEIDRDELSKLASEYLAKFGDADLMALMSKHGIKRIREGLEKPAFVADVRSFARA